MANPYASVEDLKGRVALETLMQIFDRQIEAGDALDDLIQTNLDDAAQEIDVRIGQRYVLPLPGNVAATLVYIACDITIYRIQVLRPKDDIKDAKTRYDTAIKWLTDIQTGKVDLVGAVLTEASDSGGQVGQVTSSGRVFSRESLRYF